MLLGLGAMLPVIVAIAFTLDRYTVSEQLTRTVSDMGIWSAIQDSPIRIWVLVILCICILLYLARKKDLLLAASDASSSQTGLVPSGDEKVQLGRCAIKRKAFRANKAVALNALAATKTKARRDTLATRYIWKWRFIVANRCIERLRATKTVAEATHLNDDQIKIVNENQQSELTSACEGQNPEQSSLQEPENTTSEIHNLPDSPLPAAAEPTESPTQLDMPPSESSSTVEESISQPTPPAEASLQGESPQSLPLDHPTPVSETPDGGPEPTHPHSRSSEGRNKARKGMTKFHKAPQKKTAIPTWLANSLAEEGSTEPQSNSPPLAPKSPKIEKEEQPWAEGDKGFHQESRLAGMVFEAEGPVKPTQCAHDKSCALRVCGKAHHGPHADPATPFKPEEWCWYDRACTRRTCHRWHSSPASADGAETWE